MKTKRAMVRLTLFLLLLCNGLANASTRKWSWETGLGGRGTDYVYSTLCDTAGNVYVGGTFQDTLRLSGTVTLIGGGSNAFLVKYNRIGGILWAKKAGVGTCIGKSLAFDAYGHVLLGVASDSSSFVAVYGQDGAFVWSLPTTGTLNSIAADAAGNLVVAGSSATEYFNSRSQRVWSVSAGQAVAMDRQGNVFKIGTGLSGGVTKYYPSGAYAWGAPFGRVGSVQCITVAADALGRIRVVGKIGGIDLPNNQHFSGNGGIAVACFDTSGSPMWARQVMTASDLFGAAGDDTGRISIACTASRVYVLQISPNGDTSLVVDSASIQSGGACDIYAVASDPWGNAVIGGRFSKACVFGQDTVSTNGGYDGLVAMISSPPIGSFERQIVFPLCACKTQTRDSVVRLSNVGGMPLHVTGVSLLGSGSTTFTLSKPSTPFVVPPDSTVEIGVQYRPDLVGSDTAIVSVACDDERGNVQIKVIGTLGQILLVTLQDSIKWHGLRVGDTATASVVVLNRGSVASGVQVSTNPPFDVQPTRLTLTPGDSATLSVTFTSANTPGETRGSVLLTDDCGEQKSIAIVAEVGGAAVTTESAPEVFTITVAPNPASHITTVRVCGQGVSNPTLRLLDQLGRLVRLQRLEKPMASQGMFSLDLSTLPLGLYIAEIRSGSTIARSAVAVYK
jgi:hypothetical protein